MTATCSQRKFLEAVKKFHCCPFSRVVSTAAAYFLFGPRFSLSLSLLVGQTKDERSKRKRSRKGAQTKATKKNSENKVSLFIAHSPKTSRNRTNKHPK